MSRFAAYGCLALKHNLIRSMFMLIIQSSSTQAKGFHPSNKAICAKDIGPDARLLGGRAGPWADSV